MWKVLVLVKQSKAKVRYTMIVRKLRKAVMDHRMKHVNYRQKHREHAVNGLVTVHARSAAKVTI